MVWLLGETVWQFLKWLNIELPYYPWWRVRLPWWLRQHSVCLQCGRPGFDPWVRKILWRRKWQPTPVPLPGKSHGRRSLVCYSGVAKSWTRLSDFTFTILSSNSTLSYRKKWKCIHTTCKQMFIVALFITARNKNKSNTHQINKMWHIQTMDIIKQLKRNWVLIHATTWINFKWKKPGRKSHILCDLICMKCPELLNLYMEKVG